ncbi:MAG: phosphodiesterase [Roseibium sp.]|uniref:phosphodiesterase n=1 Tax=Roseibium sp. TaxID=1936156 RepID=UPI001B249167|nr:phosphodiesterase [Roseibium sp.]MBO6891453.1 phosphodiesterase [Roseibium sp.]MBO6929292.1 phosphodiesterase [Roseibium sp.]
MTLIAQITDLHLRPRGLACYRVSDTNMFAERAIRSLQAFNPKPDALVVTGDLTDRSDPREYAVGRELLSRLDMPVFVVPGNHDNSDDMRRALPEFPGMSESRSGKIYYAADVGSVQVIALDTFLPNSPCGEVGREQLTWLDGKLRENTKPTLIALHHPPALSGITHMDNMGLLDADALAEIVAPCDHVERFLCGHLHRPIIANFAGKIMTLAPSTGHQVVLDLTENGPALFNFEPAAYFVHFHSERTGVVSHMAYVESYPGPYNFFADEGVVWPGDEC